MALRHIGVDPIVTMDPPHTKQSQRDCALFYPQSVRTVLRVAPWAFARKIRTLTSYTVPEVYEEISPYAYAYPSDCAKFLRLTSPDTTTPQKYTIVRTATDEKILMTDVENAVGEYTMVVSSPTWFDSDFVEAVSLRLAVYLAGPLRGDQKKVDAAAQRYGVAVADAQRNNRLEDFRQDFREDPWIESRAVY